MALLNPMERMDGDETMSLEELRASRRAGWAVHKGNGKRHAGATDFIDRSGLRLVEADYQAAADTGPQITRSWRGAAAWRMATACLGVLVALGKHNGFNR